MRILIVGGSRVGGTRIGEWLSYELGIEYIHEPSAMWRRELGIEQNKRKLHTDITDSVIVKVFPGKELETILRENGNWDKIIGLVRNNEEECAQSIVRAENTNEWHKDYNITNEWLKENEDGINDALIRVREWRDSVVNNPLIECQISYEGIYETKSDRDILKEYLNVKEWVWERILNPEFRYRKDKVKGTHKKNLI